MLTKSSATDHSSPSIALICDAFRLILAPCVCVCVCVFVD